MKKLTLAICFAASMAGIVTSVYLNSADADGRLLKIGEAAKDQTSRQNFKSADSRDQIHDERSRRFLDLMNQGVWKPECVDPDFIDFMIRRNPLIALEFYQMCPEGDMKYRSYALLINCWFGLAPENFLSNMGRIAGTDLERNELIEALANIGTDALEHRPPDEYLSVTSRLAKLFEEGSRVGAIQSLEEKVLTVFSESNDPASIDAVLSGSGFGNKVDEALCWRARLYAQQVEEYYTSAGRIMPDAVAKGIVENSMDSELMDLARGVDDFVRFDWKDDLVMNSTGSRLMQFYLDQDSIEASSDVAKLAPGPKKDVLIFEMVRWLFSKGAHAEAGPWIEQVQDQGMRERIGTLRGR